MCRSVKFWRTTIVFRSLLGPPLLPFPSCDIPNIAAQSRRRREHAAGQGCRGADDADDYSRAMQDHDGGVPESEEARGKAEKGPGIADRAYRESLGLTAPEFVDLRRIEVQKEIV